MFLELLESEVFTAKNLVTPWNKCKKAQFGSKIKKSFLKEIESLDIDNIPVCHGESVLGYARRPDLTAGEICREEHVYRNQSQCLVDPSMRLPDLAGRIRQDGLEDYKLYFVGSPGTAPLGVITYADLNRRTVYIYCYIMLNFLEQWVKRRITDKYAKPNRSLSQEWMNSLGSVRKKSLIEEAKERRQTPLGVADLDDLVRVLREDLEPQMNRQRRRMISSAMALRTGVAHPVKLLLPRSDSEALNNMIFLWRGMIPLVQDNDFNEKNGGWPMHPS